MNTDLLFLGLGILLAFVLLGAVAASIYMMGRSQRTLQQDLAQGRQELRDQLGIWMKDVEGRLQNSEQTFQQRLDGQWQQSFKFFQSLSQNLSQTEKQLQSLASVGQGVHELNSLLKLPHLRGGFGEAHLERLLADFLPAAAFSLQHEIVPLSSERVDAVVFFPSVKLPIDSKFPREQVAALFDPQSSPESLAQARKTLADVLKAQAKSIAHKYIHPEHGTTDLALLFLPSETLYFEAIRDQALWQDLAKLKVFPTSPNTLSIALQFIGRSLHYYEAAQGVQTVLRDLAKARKHLEHFGKKFEDVGKHLDKAHESYSTATRHMTHFRSGLHRLAGGDADDQTAPTLEEQGPSA